MPWFAPGAAKSFAITDISRLARVLEPIIRASAAGDPAVEAVVRDPSVLPPGYTFDPAVAPIGDVLDHFFGPADGLRRGDTNLRAGIRGEWR